MVIIGVWVWLLVDDNGKVNTLLDFLLAHSGYDERFFFIFIIFDLFLLLVFYLYSTVIRGVFKLNFDNWIVDAFFFFKLLRCCFFVVFLLMILNLNFVRILLPYGVNFSFITLMRLYIHQGSIIQIKLSINMAATFLVLDQYHANLLTILCIVMLGAFQVIFDLHLLYRRFNKFDPSQFYF